MIYKVKVNYQPGGGNLIFDTLPSPKTKKINDTLGVSGCVSFEGFIEKLNTCSFT